VLPEITDLYSYNKWANQETLRAAAELGDDAFARDMISSFPSLCATMVHMLGAEVVWLQRWHGDPLGNARDVLVCDTVARLSARWEQHWAQQERFINALSAEELSRPVQIRTRSGLETVQALGDTLRHVVNHATYHRGQVTTLIRQLGGTPASTDYFNYCLLRDGSV
jgi:uncharacterized damage-inducible protein DinB